MIEKLKVIHVDTPPISWWSTPFPHKRTFTFKSGINLLWGPNGSGKSTIIKALARMTHCEQGGVSTVTSSSIKEVLGLNFHKKDTINMSVQFDGKQVIYFEPSNQVGIAGNSFDYDFFVEGVANASSKASSGQLAIERFARLMKRGEEEIIWKVHKDRVNDVWAKKVELIKKMLTPTIEKGPPTILMDEPDAALDWPNKLPLWKWVQLEGVAEKVQFIIATHSIFGLWLMQHPNVHVIELKKGYREDCEVILKAAGFWSPKD